MEHIYQWIQNIVSYLVLLTVAMQLVSGSTYQKYVRFFVGLIILLMLVEPIGRMVGSDILEDPALETELREIEDKVLRWENELEESNHYGNENQRVIP